MERNFERSNGDINFFLKFLQELEKRELKKSNLPTHFHVKDLMGKGMLDW